MHGELDIAVVHHRTPGPLQETLAALALHAPEVPVVVVDTAFDAALADALSALHPKLRWQPAANHSYAHAFNVALDATRAPLVAVMNADVVVGPQTLPALANACRPADVAASGPLLRTADGRLQPMGLPYRLLSARLQLRERLRRSRASAAPPAEIDAGWLSGALLVVKRAAVAAGGGMDPRFRFYNEDLEWGWRLSRLGWRLRLVASEALHYGGAATPSDPRFQLEGWRGGLEVARRFLPAWLQGPQRLALYLAARSLARRQSDPEQRRRVLEAAERLRGGRFDEPIFGPTLGSDPEPTPPRVASER